MSGQTQSLNLSSLQRLLLLAFLLSIFAMPAVQAQTDTERQSYDIPAGPLSSVLSRFAAEAGILLSADAELTTGKTSDGLQGKYSTEKGLERLLNGTGLKADREADGSLQLRQAEPAGTRHPNSDGQADAADGYDSARLDQISVEGRNDTALGPVDGFVARRSITGTKMDTPLLETPQSITVITSDQIEAQGADTLDEAFSYSAGIYPLGGGGQRLSGTGFVVRGFNITGSTPLYVNGSRFPINSITGAQEPYFYERIELLKGPASILYGAAAPGGIINMVSKLPTQEPLREIEVQAGSWEHKQINADFGGRLSDDGDWSYRITGLVRDSDTMIEQIPDDRAGLSSAIRWQPSNDTVLTLLGSYQDNETIYNYGKPFDGTILPNPNGEIARDLFVGEPGVDKFETQRATLGYRFEHRFNDTWKVRQNVLWYDTDTDYAYTGISNMTTPPARRLVNRFLTTRVDQENGFSIDNQLQAQWQLGRFEHTALLGLDYNDTEFSRVQGSGSAAPLDVFNPVYGAPVTRSPDFRTSDSESRQLGIYLQDHIKFDKHWILLLSGRWDDVEEDSRNALSTGAASTTETEADAFTFRTGLMYLFDNGLAPYVSYTESFQPTSGVDFFGNPFDPTEGEQYEAGIKFEPNSYNAALTISAYELTQTNVLTSDPTNPGFSIQRGEVRSRGVEVEGRASLNHNLDLVAAYAFTDTEVTKSNDADLGRQLASAPRNMASLWVDYHVRAGAARGLSLGGGIRYVGKSYNFDNTVEVPSFTVADTALRYRLDDHWRFRLNANNIFDRDYVAACTFACFHGNERNVTVTASYSW